MSQASGSESAANQLLDADTPDTVRMSAADATELAKGAALFRPTFFSMLTNGKAMDKSWHAYP